MRMIVFAPALLLLSGLSFAENTCIHSGGSDVRVKSFDRDVLGKLCQFLQVKPGDLLVEVEREDLFGLLHGIPPESD